MVWALNGVLVSIPEAVAASSCCGLLSEHHQPLASRRRNLRHDSRGTPLQRCGARSLLVLVLAAARAGPPWRAIPGLGQFHAGPLHLLGRGLKTPVRLFLVPSRNRQNRSSTDDTAAEECERSWVLPTAEGALPINPADATAAWNMCAARMRPAELAFPAMRLRGNGAAESSTPASAPT